LRLIASNDGADRSVKINQDAKLFVSLLRPAKKRLTVWEASGTHGFASRQGEVELNGQNWVRAMGRYQ